MSERERARLVGNDGSVVRVWDSAEDPMIICCVCPSLTRLWMLVVRFHESWDALLSNICSWGVTRSSVAFCPLQLAKLKTFIETLKDTEDANFQTASATMKRTVDEKVKEPVAVEISFMVEVL